MEIKFTDNPDGRSKLEAVATAWGVVQNENEAHRKYVTEAEWDQWVKHNEKVSTELSEIVDRYNGVSLTEDDSEFLDTVIKGVGKAKRVSEGEFIEKEFERIARVEAEKDRKESIAANERELNGFKFTLKNLFKKK